MKKITVFTLLVTMVTMKEGKHRLPNFSKISSDVHQQTVCSIIFFSNYTYLIYVAPNPLTQDSLVPCFTLSKMVASKLNHLAEQLSMWKIIYTVTLCGVII